jgi:hypothetical protein
MNGTPSIHDGILVAINKPTKPKKVEYSCHHSSLSSPKTLSLIALHRALPRLLAYISPPQSAFVQGRSTADIFWTLRSAKAVADSKVIQRMFMKWTLLRPLTRSIASDSERKRIGRYFHLLDHPIPSLSYPVNCQGQWELD